LLLKQLLGAPQPQVANPEEEVEKEIMLTKFHVNSEIKFRYSRTEVKAYYKNPGSKANKATFSMVIPESAFISNFSMTVGDKEHVAEVKAKEEAKKNFEDAVSSGVGAGLVSKDTRDSNIFSVDTNLEPQEKCLFTLTYEELLERQDGKYQYILSINPGAIVDDFVVQVYINESLPLSSLEVPEMLESNEIEPSNDNGKNKIANVTRPFDGSPNNAQVVFAPNKQYQLEAGDQGVSGKFVVRYDVDRQGQDSEVQVIDGYFVHYFVPSELQTLPKHVVFVLDISGSMRGEKMRQMKDAMFTVFDDMTESDYFNLVAFSDRVNHWDEKFYNLRDDYDYADISDEAQKELLESLPFFQATEKNKDLAISTVLDLKADGGTNINDAIVAAMDIAKEAIKKNEIPKNVKSMVVFLTDGLPSSGVTDDEEIKANIKKSNGDLQIPVFTIAFGEDTDISLLQGISSENDAISKRIYEGSDAALQLEDFYAQISSPLLSKLQFEYVGGLVNDSTVTDSTVNTLFKGGEFVVTGKLKNAESGILGLNVTGYGKDGLYRDAFNICLRNPEVAGADNNSSFSFPSTLLLCDTPVVYPKSDAQSFLQKLFAFKHIKQIFKKRDLTQSEEKKQKLTENATQLALENNFVTDLTSLIVIKPDEEPKVTEFVEIIIPQSVQKSTNRLQTFGIQPASLQLWSIPPRRPVQPSYDYYYDKYLGHQESFAFDSDQDEDEEVISTPAPEQCSNGTLTLYSKTYHRGQEVELSESEADLRGQNFTNKAVSALLTGDCCWELHADPSYTGDVVTLKPGEEYSSVTSLGKLFRKVESVKKTKIIC